MLRTRAHAPLPDLEPPGSLDAEAGDDGSGLPLKPTLSSRAYQQIRGMLLDGSLGEGMLVSEQGLARELGISRTPVREAIRRLRAERLVEQVHRVGTMVRKPDPAELAELFDLREALEVFAARHAAEAGAAADQLQRLDRLCDAMMVLARRLQAADRDADGDEAAAIRGLYFAADIAFHGELMQTTGNAAMLALVRDTRIFTRIFIRSEHSAITPMDIARVYGHHRRILNAIRRGDADGAGRCTAHHIRASKVGKLPSLQPAPVASV